MSAAPSTTIARQPEDRNKSANGHKRTDLLKALQFYILRGDVDHAVYCVAEYVPLFTKSENSARITAALMHALCVVYWFKVDCRHLPYIYKYHEAAMTVLDHRVPHFDEVTTNAITILARYVTALACAPKSSMVDDLYSVFCTELQNRVNAEHDSDIEDSDDRAIDEIKEHISRGILDLVSPATHTDDPDHETVWKELVDKADELLSRVKQSVGVYRHSATPRRVLGGLFYSLQRNSLRSLYWARKCLGEEFGDTPFCSVSGDTDAQRERRYAICLIRSLKFYARKHLDNARFNLLDMLKKDVERAHYVHLDLRSVMVAAVLLCIRNPFEVDHSATREATSHCNLTDPFWWTRNEVTQLVAVPRALEEYKKAARIRDPVARLVQLNVLTHELPPKLLEFEFVKLDFWVHQHRKKRHRMSATQSTKKSRNNEK